MVNVKLAALLVFIVLCAGVIGFGAVDNLLLGGPERRVTSTPGRLEPALSPGEWVTLSGQELLRVQQAAVSWETQMGQTMVGDGSRLQVAIDEMDGRARDARSELSSRPVEAREREAQTRTVAALDELLAGLARQSAALSSGDLQAAVAEGENVRATLATLRSSSSLQQR